ncbi:MAG: hypothetical protein H6718_07825 [Polyangiaceae bacterium]|nr:hypothetical protein [Myxococcales bacterium]MCB9585290.1 hypothetical protein [Polyangiaceae bacterium]MCB9606693.1 hypothetical protein [Polyangiaceae bacterium]
MPFSEIDSVPWDKLHHAYGQATDVPDLLWSLMDPERASKELREDAAKHNTSIFDRVTYHLWGNVFHQGTVWQASAATVPFFADILLEGPRDPALQAFVVCYLHHLAMSYPQDRFPCWVDPDADFASVAGQVAPAGEPDYSGDVPYLIWVRDCYEAVEQHIEAVLPCLNSESDQVAGEVIALCASFPRVKTQTVPLLQPLARGEGVRSAWAALSLAILSGASVLPDALRLAKSSDRTIAIHGACAAVLADAASVPIELLGVIFEPLPEELAEAESPHAETLQSLVARCLVQLPDEHRAAAVSAVARQHRGCEAPAGLTLTASLLQLAFGASQVPKRASELNHTQREALEAIRDHGAFLWRGSVFGNYASMMRGWGLPTTAAALGEWLKGN